MLLSMENKETSVSTTLPNNFESRIAKIESNVYKIMSGMLNPQPTKKNKHKVDDKQISLWSDEEFGRMQKPSNDVKTDFEDFAKDQPNEDFVDEYVEDTTHEEENLDNEDIGTDYEEYQEDDTPVLEESKDEESKEPVQLNIFDQIEENETIEEEILQEDETQFEENLGDFYSDEESEPVKEKEPENQDINFFDEAETADEVEESFEEINEEPKEE